MLAYQPRNGQSLGQATSDEDNEEAETRVKVAPVGDP